MTCYEKRWEVLRRLATSLQEIIVTMQFKFDRKRSLTDFITDPYWYKFEELMKKWFYAFNCVKDGEYEIANDVINEIESDEMAGIFNEELKELQKERNENNA